MEHANVHQNKAMISRKFSFNVIAKKFKFCNNFVDKSFIEQKMTTFETQSGSVEDLYQLSFSEKVRKRIDEDFFRYSEKILVERFEGEDGDSAFEDVFEEERREAFLRAVYENEYSDEDEKPEDIFYFSD